MRLNWCLRNKDNPFLDLFYIFVDESKIELNYKKEKHIRRPKKHSACLIQNPKDRRIKLNIWGGISARGATDFVCFTNNLDRFGYKEIILKFLYPFILDKYDGNCFLHQDNDGKHSSYLCETMLKRYNLLWKKAPPYSPDLNPIEEVWAVLKKYVLKKRCQTLEELQNAVNDFLRRKLTPVRCQKFNIH